jgi:hypothetical protein
MIGNGIDVDTMVQKSLSKGSSARRHSIRARGARCSRSPCCGLRIRVGWPWPLDRLAFHRSHRHITTMPRRPTPPAKKPTATKVRNWRVAIMRARGQPLGTVAAVDRAAAEAEAVKAFGLNEDQRKRLFILERE